MTTPEKLITPNKDSIVTNDVGKVKQFWCIPLSFNVQLDEHKFKELNEAQLKYGGRLFDIITMDPPW